MRAVASNDSHIEYIGRIIMEGESPRRLPDDEQVNRIGSVRCGTPISIITEDYND